MTSYHVMGNLFPYLHSLLGVLGIPVEGVYLLGTNEGQRAGIGHLSHITPQLLHHYLAVLYGL